MPEWGSGRLAAQSGSPTRQTLDDIVYEIKVRGALARVLFLEHGSGWAFLLGLGPDPEALADRSGSRAAAERWGDELQSGFVSMLHLRHARFPFAISQKRKPLIYPPAPFGEQGCEVTCWPAV